MEEREITNWRDLTLLQLGSVLRNSVTDKNGRMFQEWLILVNDINRAEWNFRKNSGRWRRWNGFKINDSRTLFTYFFTFTAAVHKRFLYPGKSVKLEEIVQEYHLGLLVQNPKKELFNFDFYYSGMIPHQVVITAEAQKTKHEVAFVDEKGGEWIKRTNEECIGICWTRMLNYLEETNAPAPGTKAGDAFAWLEKRNQTAYISIRFPNGNFMFNYRYECEMGETYSRFLWQLDAWNPHCMKVWAAYQSRARRQLRELSAALDMPLEPG